MENAKLLMSATEVNSGDIRRWAPAFLFAGLLTTLTTVEARTYRWTDESGRVVYSQTPPPPGIKAEIIGAPPPPAESPETARERLEGQLQRLETNREQRLESRQKAADEKTKSQQAVANCAAARHNLEIYDDAPPNRLYKDSTGSYHRLSLEERDAKAEAARGAIKKYCK